MEFEKFDKFLWSQLSEFHAKLCAEYQRQRQHDEEPASDLKVPSERLAHHSAVELALPSSVFTIAVDQGGAECGLHGLVGLDGDGVPKEKPQLFLLRPLSLSNGLTEATGGTVKVEEVRQLQDAQFVMADQPSLQSSEPQKMESQNLQTKQDSLDDSSQSPESPRTPRVLIDPVPDNLVDGGPIVRLRKNSTRRLSSSKGKFENTETCFELDHAWREEIAAEISSSRILGVHRNASFGDNRSSISSASVRTEMPVEEETNLEGFVRRNCNFLNSWVVHPNAKKRLAWDFFGMACIAYDMVMIPFQVFDPPVVWWMEAVALTISLFWTIDMPSSFFVGYHQGGLVHMRFVQSAKRYAMSWFPIDVLLVVSDWLDFLSHEFAQEESMESVGLARLGKSMRFLRIVRLFRLLRLIKLPRYLLQLEEHIQSEYTTIALGIMKQIMCILVMNHYVACIWYGIGTDFQSNLDKKISWVTYNNLKGTGLEYTYTTSMHWSLTQFTPASMEVFPTNRTERLFTIIVLVFAMVTFSSFISSITNAMTRLRSINSEYAKQLLVFQRYLRYHKVSTPLSVRMRRHLEHRVFRENTTIDEKDVQFVKLLSDPLRIELHLEVYAPHLENHIFFQLYNELNHAAMRKVCHTAVMEMYVSQGDTLFSFGESCDAMLFVKGGRLHYYPAACVGTMVTPESTDWDWQPSRASVEHVYGGDWLCEACLWVQWLHVGDAVAQSRCTFLGINKSKFQLAAKNSRGMRMRPSRYAEQFVEFLNNLDENDLTDLAIPGFDCREKALLASGAQDGF